MTKQLDELAKSLAGGMPRRKALKLLLVGLVGAAVAPEAISTAVTPDEAHAAKLKNCPSGLIACGTVCCAPGFCVHVNGNQLLCEQPNGSRPVCPPGQQYVLVGSTYVCMFVNGG